VTCWRQRRRDGLGHARRDRVIAARAMSDGVDSHRQESGPRAALEFGRVRQRVGPKTVTPEHRRQRRR
jgi:hypothetical protein